MRTKYKAKNITLSNTAIKQLITVANINGKLYSCTLNLCKVLQQQIWQRW